MKNITVIMVGAKYAENIGSMVRVCMNMGVSKVSLVLPKDFNLEKAYPLATHHGKDFLERIEFFDTLSDALQDFTTAYAVTARVGGWRKGFFSAREAGEKIAKESSMLQQADKEREKIAIVFGAEDKGLENKDVFLCDHIITIPTTEVLRSLNLSHAGAIILYEIHTAYLQLQDLVADNKDNIDTKDTKNSNNRDARDSRDAKEVKNTQELGVSFQEKEVLEKELQKTLIAVDFFKKPNEDYWMLPIKRFLSRFTLRSHEYALLMGICRQIQWVLSGEKKNEDHKINADKKTAEKKNIVEK